MSLMSSRALSTIRRSTERWMVDTLEIWRAPDDDYNDGTLVSSRSGGTKVYDGKGRVRPTTGPRELAVSEGVIVLRDAEFLIPITAALPWRDDEVFVRDSEDSALVGTWFRITNVRVFSQQAARGFSGLAGQPSRLWPNLAIPYEEPEEDPEEDPEGGDD